MSKRILLGLSRILLCSNFIYSMDPDMDPASEYSLADEFLPYDQQGISIEDIDKVWEKVPAEVSKWAEELKHTNGQHRELPYRLVLYGIPGTGKTTMALGIAKNNSDAWSLSRIDAADLITHGRGGAAAKLRKRFNAAVGEGVKTIVLIDEAHHLMANHASKNYDTAETTEVLQKFLDRHANNSNVMVILTGNHVNDMTPEMRSRISHFGVQINPPTQEELWEMFQYHGSGLLYEQVAKSDILRAYEAGQIIVGRDVKFFCRQLRQAIRDSGCANLKEFSLSKDFLIAQAELFRKKAKEFGAEEISLSDREFQQQLHDDGKWFQVKLAAAGLATKVAYDQYRKSQSSSSSSSTTPVIKPEEGNSSSVAGK